METNKNTEEQQKQSKVQKGRCVEWERFSLIRVLFVLAMILWPLATGDNILQLIPQFIIDASDRAFNQIENETFFKVIALILILLMDIGLWLNWVRDKHVSYTKSLATVFITEILLFSKDFTYASLGPCDVNTAIGVNLLVLLAIRCVIACKNLCKTTSKGKSGFVSNTYRDVEQTSEAKRNFIESLIQKLYDTSLEDNAFSVGISGDWGSGKTTFLNLIKSGLNERAYIISFNPWAYKGPEQVMNDFFNTLRQGLKKQHYLMGKPIAEYASLVTETATSGMLSVFIKLMRLFIHYTLQDKKDQLSALLKKVDKPIWIFVDDMDRLEQEEIFEVLRLIRNVGDLSNIVYITAYDKDFVVKMLEKRGIEQAEVYLEKIFDVEFCLPRVEPFELKERLLDDLKSSGVDKALCSEISLLNMNPILDILNNYRQIKRFARLYSLNLHYMQTQMKDDFHAVDLFWLSLLQMYDLPTYDNLFYKTSAYLQSDGTRYWLRKGIAKNATGFEFAEEDLDKNLQMNECTPILLAYLFATNDGYTSCSIRYNENFRKYFSLIKDKKSLPNPEFKALLERPTQSSVESAVQRWNEDEFKLASILFQFEIEKKSSLTINQSKNLLWALVWVILTNKDCLHGKSKSCIERVLSCTGFNREHVNELREYLDQEIHNLISDQRNPFRLNELLAYFYSIEYVNGIIVHNPNSFFTNERVKELVKENAKSYLKSHTDLKLEDMFNVESEFSEFVKSCTFVIKAQELSDYVEYENLAESVWLDSPNLKHSILSQDELKIAYKAMYKNEIIQGTKSDGETYTIIKKADDEYNQHLGTNRNWVDLLIARATCV